MSAKKRLSKRASSAPGAIDPTRLRAALVRATRAGFKQLQRNHEGETCYAFCLYHDPEWRWILPSSNTEEALEALGGEQLRWEFPADWAYHLEGEEHFEPVAPLLAAAALSEDREDEQHWLALWDTLRQTCVQALQELDRLGTFGTGRAREKIALLVRTGDEDEDEWLKTVRQLNPKSVFKRVQSHFDDPPEFQPTPGRLTFLLTGFVDPGQLRAEAAVFYEANDLAAAVRLALRATELAAGDASPESFWIWNDAAYYLVLSERFEEALERADVALKVGTHPFAWNNKGDALAGLGRTTMAAKCWKEALKLNHPWEEQLKEKIHAAERR